MRRVVEDSEREKWNILSLSESESLFEGANVITDSLGLAIQNVDYYPYGETRINETWTSFDSTFKFTGQGEQWRVERFVAENGDRGVIVAKNEVGKFSEG